MFNVHHVECAGAGAGVCRVISVDQLSFIIYVTARNFDT